MQHPAVAFVGAIGQPDAHSGELPAAYVELCAGGDGDRGGADSRMRAAQIAEPAAVPKHVEIVAELPKTAVGKVFKPDLRRQRDRAGVRRGAGRGRVGGAGRRRSSRTGGSGSSPSWPRVPDGRDEARRGRGARALHRPLAVADAVRALGAMARLA